MKVLIINGSPRANGNTAAALDEMKKIFSIEGIESVDVHVGRLELHSCVACMSCMKTGKCVFDDAVNKTAPILAECDGVVIGSPVHYGQAPGALTSFLSRLFYSTWSMDKSMKVGAVMVSARRSGATSTFDELNKFFTISQMPVVTSTYWTMVHGKQPEDVLKDEEGLQTMRNLASNMAWMLRCIEAGKAAGIQPPQEEFGARTNFIR